VMGRFALERSENYRGILNVSLDGEQQSFYNFTNVERNDSRLIGNTQVLTEGQTQTLQEYELLLKLDDMAGVRFYLDYIIYLPPLGAAHDGDVVAIAPRDPRLSFSPGWETYPDNGDVYTTNLGSSVTVSFNGTSHHNICLAIL
jgi:hypothetical protein